MALNSDGFLGSTVSMIRQMIDSPSANAKFTDADLITYLRGSIATVMADFNALTDHPYVARVDLAIVADKQVYTLPPQVQKIYYMALIDSTSGLKIWELYPGSIWDFSGYGFRLEGNTMRLLTKWKTGYTIQIAFVPNAEPFPILGSSSTYSASTFTFPSSATDGTLDTRPQSYAGYMLRILSSSDSAAVYTQDRYIASYNNQTRVATMVEDFSPTLVGTVVFEVVPCFSLLFQQVWALHVAQTIMGLEGSTKQYNLLEGLYQKRLRSLRMSSKKEFRAGQTFENRTADNDRGPYGGLWGLG